MTQSILAAYTSTLYSTLYILNLICSNCSILYGIAYILPYLLYLFKNLILLFYEIV